MFWPGFLQYVSDQASSPHGMVGVGCLLNLPALLSPENNSAFYPWGYSEWSHQCSEDTNLSDGDQLLLLNLKGFMAESIMGVKTSLPQKQSLLLGLVPCHPLPHPAIMERGKCLSAEFAPPLFAVLHFPMIWQKHHLCTIYSYQIHWIPRDHDRYKGLEIFGFCKN